MSDLPSLLSIVEDERFRQQLMTHYSTAYPAELLEALIRHYGLYAADYLLTRTHDSYYSPYHAKNITEHERKQIIDDYYLDYYRCRVLLNVCDAWVLKEKSFKENREIYKAFWHNWWEVTKRYKKMMNQEMRERWPRAPKKEERDHPNAPPFYGQKEWDKEQEVKKDIEMWLRGEIHSLRPPPRVFLEDTQVKLEYTPMAMADDSGYAQREVKTDSNSEWAGGWGESEETAAASVVPPTTATEAPAATGASDWD